MNFPKIFSINLYYKLKIIIVIFSISSIGYPISIKTKIVDIKGKPHISILEFAKNHKLQGINYAEKNKFELRYFGKKIVFSGKCSFVKVEDKILQLSNPIITLDGDIYIAKNSFMIVLNKTELPDAILDTSEEYIITTAPDFNLYDISIDTKMNGSQITIKSSKIFNLETIASSITRAGWLNITILDGIVDSSSIVDSPIKFPVKQIRCLQLPESAQISLLLKTKVDDYEITQTKDGSAIKISLRIAMTETSDRIKKSRRNWLLDTIVIDAGHGGKDKGAVSSNGLQEKTVCLDISKRLGKLIQNKMGVKVIYTRDEDVFIPLWKRTKIANESGGKVFISIHANSSPHSKQANGFETYLLRPGKTQDAIEVAQRENAVIAMEEAAHDYGDFTDEQIILATMAQHEFMKESEFLADVIQQELDKRLKTPNRGVKQAGFYVLVGGSMPNVLVETGFLSNRAEARLLGKPSYRQKIAEGIFNALVNFKDKYESTIIGIN